ncbi:MAG: DNA repair protein RecO [Alphaproteobacteria bacterium]|jgi:DNA repair protein RecO (recombination protein O)|nr:DNA repair protein RecO [Alphaproteobacteria bacterium]MBT4017639.1 DNA repair protein RecO [Alphaproteobacteria bacterium]MBT4966590.1 DNA repair protein RecO [Alphaproteobacteria bacterium]MBT5161730.1 DNA repair protein RecO [Alphaproteobacteria bacterium]
MQWTDDAILLSARKHGETSVIVQALTQCHGRHGGLVRGGVGRGSRGVLQPGNEIQGTWKARLPDHLGSYTIELKRARAAHLLNDAARLAALSAACSVAEAALPEREIHVAAYDGFLVLLEALETSDHWAEVYISWELGLLRELGFGLDLSACAQTGETEGLAFVSPRTGRAVTAAAGAPYKERLLALPGFLAGQTSEETAPQDLIDGLALTGFFVERHVLAPHNIKIPPARTRFVERFTQ